MTRIMTNRKRSSITLKTSQSVRVEQVEVDDDDDDNEIGDEGDDQVGGGF